MDFVTLLSIIIVVSQNRIPMFWAGTVVAVDSTLTSHYHNNIIATTLTALSFS